MAAQLDASAAETDELLRRLWTLTLRAHVARLEKVGDLSAADLNVTRQFIADNGISKDTLVGAKAAAGLTALLDRMPAFAAAAP